MTSTDTDLIVLDLTLLSLSTTLKIPLLFRIPQALLVGILSEWLDLQSLGRFDSSMCSKKYRPAFMNSLHIMRSTTVENVERGRWSSCNPGEWSGWWWRWLSLRQIYVESVFLSGKVHNIIWLNAIDSNELLVLPSVRRIYFFTCSDDDLGYLVRTCPNLQSLHVATNTALFLPQTGLLAQFYDRRNEPYVSEIGLNYIAQSYQHCLESFSYDRNVWCVGGPENDFPEGCVDHFMRTGQALIDLLRQCTRLQEVDLTSDSLRAIDLSELCAFGHLFNELRFEGYPCLGPSDQAISNLLHMCINLRKLTYNGDRSETIGKRLVLSALSQSCSLLEELKLKSIYADTWGTTLPRLCDNLSVLLKLVLTDCELTDAYLRTMAFGLVGHTDLQFLDCEGLTNTGVSYLSKLKLVNLVIEELDRQDGEVHVAPSVLTEAAFTSFASPESLICDTLESFHLHIMLNYEQHRIGAVPIADDQVAMSFATCHQLKNLHIFWGSKCEFGVANGTVGLAALVINSPILYLNTSEYTM